MRTMMSRVSVYVLLSSATTTLAMVTATSGFKVGNQAAPGLKNGMDYIQLGDSDLVVSKVCMGTMTFGEQNTLEEGVEQLQTALDEYGINFLDTAEIYPVPTKPDTQGRTDAAVAEFMKKNADRRSEIVLATKVAGRNENLKWLPRAEPETSSALTKEQILYSVDRSLERLGVDYIDLLQLHWPDRYTGGLFGSPDFDPETYLKQNGPDSGTVPSDFEEQLAACNELIKSGKVRYIGVSNETPYGVCSMAALAKHFPDLYPKIVSIQNSYSLVVRKDFEAGLAEACYHHNVGLLSYSPLAGGSLSGKYRPDKDSSRGRLHLFPGYMERYLGSQNEDAVNAYCELAESNDMTPSELALAWCYHRNVVASTIIGATTLDQLHENIKAYDIKLEDEIHEAIGDIYKKYTDPTKAKNKAT